jgi:hypothetical protein
MVRAYEHLTTIAVKGDGNPVSAFEQGKSSTNEDNVISIKTLLEIAPFLAAP